MQDDKTPPVVTGGQGEEPAHDKARQKPGGRKKLTIILVAAVVVLGAAGFAVWASQRGDYQAPTAGSAPAPSKPKTEKLQGFTFAAAGDFGTSDNAAAVLQKIGEANVNFTLALGDLSYAGNGSEPAWCDFVKQKVGQEHPFELIAGNHDDGTSEGNILEFRKCLPDRIGSITGDYGLEYYFDYNKLARFILISPDIDDLGFNYSKGSPHYDWLAAAIDGAQADGLEWVVLGMHKNCITVGTKVCEIGEDVLNLAVEKKVDIILQGHEHAYIRSKQLGLSAGCPKIVAKTFNPACVTSPGNDFSKDAGSLLVISGAGGMELRDINLGDEEIGYFATWNGSNSGNTYGFSKFTITADKLTAEFIPANGPYTDTFTLTAR